MIKKMGNILDILPMRGEGYNIKTSPKKDKEQINLPPIKNPL